MTTYILEVTFEDGPCTIRPYLNLEDAKKVYDLTIKSGTVELAKISILGGQALYTYAKGQK